MPRSSSSVSEAVPQAQLLGQRVRLQRELGQAFSAQHLSHALISRIVSDLARIEQALAGDRWRRSHDRAVQGALSIN